MTISLTNIANRCFVFVLAHETYCKALGDCACIVEQGRALRRIPRSITLASGVMRAELHEAVLALPEVVRALRRGELTVKLPVAEPSVSAPMPKFAMKAASASRSTEAARAKKKRGVK